MQVIRIGLYAVIAALAYYTGYINQPEPQPDEAFAVEMYANGVGTGISAATAGSLDIPVDSLTPKHHAILNCLFVEYRDGILRTYNERQQVIDGFQLARIYQQVGRECIEKLEPNNDPLQTSAESADDQPDHG